MATFTFFGFSVIFFYAGPFFGTSLLKKSQKIRKKVTKNPNVLSLDLSSLGENIKISIFTKFYPFRVCTKISPVSNFAKKSKELGHIELASRIFNRFVRSNIRFETDSMAEIMLFTEYNYL